MLSKERSRLRARASKIDTMLIIGKGGVAKGVFDQASNIIKKYELLKGKVLNNSVFSAEDAAKVISENTNSEVVCSIGNKFVLYKKRDLEKERKYKKRNQKKVEGNKVKNRVKRKILKTDRISNVSGR